MNCITYPARPMNGGNFLLAPPKVGEWACEPKFNGWRALVHIPTGTMYNRHAKPLTIAKEFAPALELMRNRLDAECFKWADCEALERRHGIGRGCLIVLDVIPSQKPVGFGSDVSQATYAERRRWLQAVLHATGVVSAPMNKEFPLLSLPPLLSATKENWLTLQGVNAELGCDFYEGFVMKRKDSPYPVQTRTPDFETCDWMKHRFL